MFEAEVDGSGEKQRSLKGKDDRNSRKPSQSADSNRQKVRLDGGRAGVGVKQVEQEIRQWSDEPMGEEGVMTG